MLQLSAVQLQMHIGQRNRCIPGRSAIVLQHSYQEYICRTINQRHL